MGHSKKPENMLTFRNCTGHQVTIRRDLDMNNPKDLRVLDAGDEATAPKQSGLHTIVAKVNGKKAKLKTEKNRIFYILLADEGKPMIIPESMFGRNHPSDDNPFTWKWSETTDVPVQCHYVLIDSKSNECGAPIKHRTFSRANRTDARYRRTCWTAGIRANAQIPVPGADLGIAANLGHETVSGQETVQFADRADSFEYWIPPHEGRYTWQLAVQLDHQELYLNQITWTESRHEPAMVPVVVMQKRLR